MLWKDLQYGVRTLMKRPVLTAMTVLTLGLGIGVTTAMFSIVDGVYLRAMPAADPDRLALIRTQTPQGVWPMISYADYSDLQREKKSFESILAFARESRFLHLGGEAEMILVDVISPNYFEVLGLSPVTGQFPNLSTTSPSAVIGYDLWQRRFGADPGLIGQQIRLNDKFVTVTGIAPAGFNGLQRFVPTHIWLPATDWMKSEELLNRDSRSFELVGRLNSEVSIQQARGELASMSANLASAYPATNRDRTFIATSEGERVRNELPAASYLLAAACLVLIIACANVAGLLLAVSESRRKEIAIREALGASRSRLIAQFLTESMILALLAAGAGLLLTHWLISLQPAVLPPSSVQLGFDLRVDLRTLAVAFAGTLAAVLLAGVWPALSAARTDVVSGLKSSVPGAGRTRITSRNVIVAGQIALSVLLLTTAGLLFRSFLQSQKIHPGFEAGRNLLAVKIALSAEGEGRSADLFQALAGNIAALPGVKNASYARRLLLSTSGGGASKRVAFPGVDLPPDQQTPMIKYNAVAPNFFATVGTRVIEGRGFDARDTSNAAKVVIVTQALARRYWPRGEVVGKRIQTAGAEFEIVGIAEDARIINIHVPPEPYIYFPFAQMPAQEAAMVIDSSADPAALIPAVKQVIRQADSGALFLDITTSRQLMNRALWDDRTAAWLLGAISGLGVFLSGVGLYALIAWVAGRRNQEIGVRMALGASRRAVMAMILKQGLRLAMYGVPAGLLISFGAGRLLAGKLYGVSPSDPIAFAAAALAAFLVSLLACFFPARRATKVDPLVALKCE